MTFWDAVTLLGGVGLFLFGMTMMSTGLKNAAGDQLRGILERVTSNRLAGVGIGIVVTMLVQSSAATDLMVIGFVNSGLMELSQAIGVIMGANIGTTVTAQITAFNLTALAPLLLFGGCVCYIFLKKPMYRHIGSIILGFGMLFVGIGMIKSSIAPLSDSPGFIRVLSALSHPAAAVLFGVVFTALLQSSSSSVVIFQAFAVQGLLTYEQCVWLIIGAALGSITPNLLASLTMTRSGKRAVLLNLYFNLLRAALLIAVIALFPGVLNGIRRLSPDSVGRQVANTHTLFAVFSVAVLLPFARWIVAAVQRTLPLLDSERRAKDERQLIYLINPEKSLPSVALRQAELEINRMGELARDDFTAALDYFFDPSQEALYDQVLEQESTLDWLDRTISDKLITLRSMQLSDHDVFRLSRLAKVVSYFERIGDRAENVAGFAARLREAKVTISEAGMKELRELADAVRKSVVLALEIYESEDFSRLPEAQTQEYRIDEMQERFIQNHIDRLMSTACNPLSGVIFTDMCNDLERCADQAIKVAYALYDENAHQKKHILP